jgi:hypothetical protein
MPSVSFGISLNIQFSRCYESPVLEKVGRVKDLTLGGRGIYPGPGGSGSFIPAGRAVAPGQVYEKDSAIVQS